MMQAPNSLLSPRPACYATRPIFRRNLVEFAEIDGRQPTPFQTGRRVLLGKLGFHRSRPLLPVTMSSHSVVEGSIRSLLIVIAVLSGLLVGAVASPAVIARHAIGSHEEQEIVLLLRAHLSRISGWEQSAIEVSLDGTAAAIELPAGDCTLRIAARFAPSSFGTMLVPVEACVDGEPLRTFWVRAEVRVRAEVVRVTRRVPHRKILEAEDLELAAAPVISVGDVYFRNISDALGLAARRAMSPGQLLEQDWVEAPDLVRSGETVRLTLRLEGIRITTLAKVLESGKRGEYVRVRNLDTDRSLKALVTGPGEVTVQD